MLNSKQISYLPQADRAKHLYARVVAELALLAGGVLLVIFSAGTFATVAGILVAVASAFLLVSPVTMLVADRLVGSQDQAVITETGQKLADGKATAVHARVLEQLREAGKAPQSLVIAVFNTSWEAGGPLVLTSTIGTDGALATEIIDDDSSRYWEILCGIASPFVTGTDWQVTVITAAPGQPATAQLADDDGYWEIFAEMDKPAGEQFLRYHRIPASAS